MCLLFFEGLTAAFNMNHGYPDCDLTKNEKFYRDVKLGKIEEALSHLTKKGIAFIINHC